MYTRPREDPDMNRQTERGGRELAAATAAGVQRRKRKRKKEKKKNRP